MSSIELQIVPSTITDMDVIFSFFDSAIKYQQDKGYDLWPQFSNQLIETEISECRHFKVLENDNVM
ncbi:MAG: hypothetical protein V4580_02220 [Bacteroidota bacterium]